MVWLLGILLIGILVLDLPVLTRDRLYKEIFVYLVFLIVGVYMGIILIYNLPYYNPLLQLETFLDINN
jgi:hypothetical protein